MPTMDEWRLSDVDLEEASPLSDESRESRAHSPGQRRRKLCAAALPLQVVTVGLPPRALDLGQLKSVRQADGGVTFAQNPHYSRSNQPGESLARLWPLRSGRAKAKPLMGEDEVIRQKELRTEARRAAGLPVLPAKYRRVEIRHADPFSGKFEDFDFSLYNRTVFAGLENDLSNSYVNPLIQARSYRRCGELPRGGGSRPYSPILHALGAFSLVPKKNYLMTGHVLHSGSRREPPAPQAGVQERVLADR